MSKFLDSSGLAYLWQKLKQKFYTKQEVDDLIDDVAMTYSYDGNGTLTIQGLIELPDASEESY